MRSVKPPFGTAIYFANRKVPKRKQELGGHKLLLGNGPLGNIAVMRCLTHIVKAADTNTIPIRTEPLNSSTQCHRRRSRAIALNRCSIEGLERGCSSSIGVSQRYYHPSTFGRLAGGRWRARSLGARRRNSCLELKLGLVPVWRFQAEG
jgi:hypothetical protein